MREEKATKPRWFAPIFGAFIGTALGFYVGKYDMKFNPSSIPITPA